MYHVSQAPQEPTPLTRLDLAKFSYTSTSINYKGPLNWNHVIGNSDLVAIFEKYSAPTSCAERTMLKVRRDQETLEEIDISLLLRGLESQATFGQNNSTKPIFAVVVKLPCLAVKYPKDSASVRRFQIKFISDRDYYTALAILSDINCPFSESNGSTTQPTNRINSSHWNVRSATAFTGVQQSALSQPLGKINVSALASSTITSASAPTLRNVTCLPSSSSSVTTSAATSNTELTSLFENSKNNHRAPLLYKEPCLEDQNLHLHSNAHTARQTNTQTSTENRNLDHRLPPKRELPFSRPAAKRVRAGPNLGDKFTKESDADKNQKSPPIVNKSLPPVLVPTQELATTKQAPIPHNHQMGKEGNIAHNGTGLEAAKSHMGSQTLTPSDLSLYLTSSTEERTAKVEDWICMHLDDDRFLQLCQDVEGIWKRIALGK